MCDSLQPHGLQHARLFAQTHVHWVGDAHPTILSSVTLLSSCPQSYPAAGSFLMSHIFTSGGQSIAVSASASVLPMNIQGWFPFGLTGLISMQFKGLSRVCSSTTIRKHQLFWCSAFFMVQLSHLHITTGKNHSFGKMDITLPFIGKVMSVPF